MDKNIKPLNVPLENSVRYQSNFIKTAVCELRFPTLLELENNPPTKIQASLRKLYPFYSSQRGVTLGANGPSSPENRYLFESKKRDWTVALKTSTLSLETSRYTDFNEFIDRFRAIFDAVGDLLDTDFFTRVGLRYINSIPLPIGDENENRIDKWINPVLVAPMESRVLGTLGVFHCEIKGFINIDGIEDGGYTFRHGLEQPVDQNNEYMSYVLDYDYFVEGVEAGDVLRVIEQFNKQNFSLFKWSLGKRSLEALGKGEEKG